MNSGDVWGGLQFCAFRTALTSWEAADRAQERERFWASRMRPREEDLEWFLANPLVKGRADLVLLGVSAILV